MTLATTDASAALSPDFAGSIYESLMDAYGIDGRPVDVDFRALIPMMGSTERLTHQLHPYPAKLLRHIPALFASAPQLSTTNGHIVDPFCGSGTVLVEAQVAGRRATGLDTNPLARLLAKVKTTPVASAALEEGADAVLSASGCRPLSTESIPERLRYWFPPHALAPLSGLRDAINSVAPGAVKDALWVCFSATVRAVSLADPRIAVPVRLRKDQYPPGHWLHAKTQERLRQLNQVNVVERFSEICSNTFLRLARVPPSAHPTFVVEGDARLLERTPLAADTVDCVITSPPYLGAQKYIRASSLSLLWLGHGDTDDGDLRPLIAQSIGREHFRAADYATPLLTGVADADDIIVSTRSSNPLRAHLAATYLLEMRDAISGIASLLRKGGALVLVAGPNQLCRRPFDTPRFLGALAVEAGLTLELSLRDTIKSRGLMTQRNRSASVIPCETVMVFRK